MTTPTTAAVEPELHDGKETWEVQHGGTVWLWVADARARETGGYRKQRVGGQGTRRVHLTTDERRYNEEQIVDENQAEANVFRNGSLMRVDKGAPAEDIDTRYHLSDQDLRDIISVRDLALFSEEIADIKSELIIRRLMAISEVDGTAAQTEAIRTIIEERYKAGGTQRTVQELINAGEKLGGEQLA